VIVDLQDKLWVENVSDAVDRLIADFWVFVSIDDHDGKGCYVHHTIRVPAGFVTDYCSVPSIPFVHELLGDIGKRAGVVHDYLYSRIVAPELRALGRAWADRVLYYGLRAQGIGAIKAQLMWSAVRLAGCRYFQPLAGAGLQLDHDQAPAVAPPAPPATPSY
jgi:hypothetical protein